MLHSEVSCVVVERKRCEHAWRDPIGAGALRAPGAALLIDGAEACICALVIGPVARRDLEVVIALVYYLDRYRAVQVTFELRISRHAVIAARCCVAAFVFRHHLITLLHHCRGTTGCEEALRKVYSRTMTGDIEVVSWTIVAQAVLVLGTTSLRII